MNEKRILYFDVFSVTCAPKYTVRCPIPVNKSYLPHCFRHRTACSHRRKSRVTLLLVYISAKHKFPGSPATLRYVSSYRTVLVWFVGVESQTIDLDLPSSSYRILFFCNHFRIDTSDARAAIVIFVCGRRRMECRDLRFGLVQSSYTPCAH